MNHPSDVTALWYIMFRLVRDVLFTSGQLSADTFVTNKICLTQEDAFVPHRVHYGPMISDANLCTTVITEWIAW